MWRELSATANPGDARVKVGSDRQAASRQRGQTAASPRAAIQQ